MLDAASDRLKALKGGGGITAITITILSLVYKAVDAAGNAEFVLQKLPALRPLAEAVPLTNLLILLALLWIIAILLWPAALGPHGAKVRKMRKLLEEAAEFHAKHGETAKKFSDDSVHEAAWRMTKMFSFLEMAFRDGIRDELIKYQDREHQKHKAAGAHFDPDRTISQFLVELRKRITGRDLDLSFHVPDTYEQFYKQDQWIPNSVHSGKP